MPMMFDGRPFDPRFAQGPFIAPVQPHVQGASLMPNLGVRFDPMADPRVHIQDVRNIDPRAARGYRELPRYGVGTDRVSDMSQNNLMNPNGGVRQMGRHGMRDDVARAVQKMAQNQVQQQFFNRLMLGG